MPICFHRDPDDKSEAGETHLPGVTYLSDLQSGIDAKRQKGFTDNDPFAMAKSYAHVPHEYLAPDGFPKSDCWLKPACKFAVLSKENANDGKGGVVRRALDRYREQGLQDVPANPPLHTTKLRRTEGPRHAARGIKNRSARTTDQLANSANRLNQKYDCQRYRLNDPVLPYKNYDRSMEIIHNCYKIVTHGKGQFVDRDSHDLIFTYSYEDLESLTPDQRDKHQQDVSTILMSTKLFKRLPTPKPLTHPKFTSTPATTMANTIPATTPVWLPRKNDPPSSPLTSLPPSEPEVKDCLHQPQTAMRDTVGKESIHNVRSSSPLTSLPSSDAEDVVPVNPRKRKVQPEAKDLKRPSSLISKKKFLDGGKNVAKLMKPKRTITKKISFGKSVLNNKKRKRLITTNGALIHGRMHCFGQTVGYSRNILLGPYRPYKGSSRTLYQKFLDRLPDFGARIGGRFKGFCDEGFLLSRRLLNTLRAPPMTATSKLQPSGPLDFAANFAFTLGNFYNKPHTDNDKGKVYCIWYPIDSLSGQIVTECEGFDLEGGWFIFPEYRVAFKFGDLI
ncbi:uncharacterized protein MELLADRAFT_85640 [Melampsora larici-populina 98AG31]|uniref:Tet-like 2OG-Fe(II) oxygenase domain-containing protein n=1 Tax=Melampsora larici-populina (strain 98AG31 / pathotype 3-4-7) TaxID=747676 RepID=F4RJA1_MELLP|nr:uncharacterized protein MELLADRAFT_85640 [Melampsora larici-populina 98AG31]EGG07281.1 hypothetical protein MELLADRAFT_85640 [Melampsora larici-populina 98AG31]